MAGVACALLAAAASSQDATSRRSGSASLRGRCYAAETGEPIEGCEVRLRAIQKVPPYGAVREGWAPPRVCSGPDGRFLALFDLPAVSPYGDGIECEIASEGRARALARWWREGWGSGVDLSLDDVRLGKGYSLRGRVVDTEGDPLREIVVSVEGIPLLRGGGEGSLEARSREDGSFEIEGVPAGEWEVVLPGPEATLVRTERVTLGERAEAPGIVLEACRHPSVRGVVVDERDRPVEGVGLHLRLFPPPDYLGGAPPAPATSGPDGSFAIFASVAPRRERLFLQCRDPGPCEPFSDLEVTWGREVRLILRRATSFEPTVAVAETGEAVEAFRYRCWATDPTLRRFGGEVRSPTFVAPGRLRIDRVFRGTNRIVVYPLGSGLLPSREVEFEVSESGVVPPMRVEIHRSLPLAVRLRRADGSPVAGAWVSLFESGRESLAVEGLLGPARTDREGFASVRGGYEGGRFTVVVSPPGRPSIPFADHEIDGQPLDLVVPGSLLRACLHPPSVRSSSSSLWLRKASSEGRGRIVIPRYESGNFCGMLGISPVTPVDREAGVFEVGDLEPGEWEIGLELPRLHPQPSLGRVQIVEGRTTEVRLDASRFAPACLEAHLLLDSKPLAGAQVALEVRRPDASWLIQRKKTDREGRLLLEGLMPGEYRLSAEVGEYGTPAYRWIPWREWFEIGPGDRIERTFVLPSR